MDGCLIAEERDLVLRGSLHLPLSGVCLYFASGALGLRISSPHVNSVDWTRSFLLSLCGSFIPEE